MHRTELADLTEGQVVEPVELTLAEAAALNSSELVTVQPAARGWRIAAKHRVGAVRCGSLTVRVHPKVGAVQVLRLLARAHGVRGLTIDESLVDVRNEKELTAVLAVLFAQEAASAMLQGPLRGYRTEDQTASVLRGRVRLRDQELRRFGLPVPIEVTVDEWTADIVENRRIRAATHRLLAFPDLPAATRARLRRLEHQLAEVWRPPRGVLLPAWQPTRLNQRLHRLLLLADLVLDQTGIEQHVGGVDVHGYSMRMEWVFQRLVTQILTESGGTVRTASEPTKALDESGRFTIQPDLVFTERGRTVGVGDVKYKLFDDPGSVPNPDIYQLVTYCLRLGLDTGHLIYASDWPSTSFRIRNTGVTVHVHAVDLTRPVAAIEAQVRGVHHAFQRQVVG